MKKLTFKHISFVKSCAKVKNAPTMKSDQGEFFPEIAVAGRSNVGKSSLLNHLFMSKNMVKTSQKPGKTRLLNFFNVDQSVLFCDLPGYGYAKVAREMRSFWKEMIEPYIEEREQLKGILLLLDIRRDPSEHDIQFFEWAKHFQRPLIIVLTKVDKVSKNELHAQAKKIQSKLGDASIPILKYSTTKNIGRRELIFEVNRLLET